jgi:hypothetical protein
VWSKEANSQEIVDYYEKESILFIEKLTKEFFDFVKILENLFEV